MTSECGSALSLCCTACGTSRSANTVPLVDMAGLPAQAVAANAIAYRKRAGYRFVILWERPVQSGEPDSHLLGNLSPGVLRSPQRADAFEIDVSARPTQT